MIQIRKGINIFVIAVILCFLSENVVFADSQLLAQLIQEADTAFAEGDYLKAEINCEKVLKISPQFYHAYNLLGKIYGQEDGKESEALGYFEKSIEICSQQPSVYIIISSLYMESKNPEKAFKYLSEGVKNNPQDFNLNYNLGVFYLVQKQDVYKALPYFEEAEKQQPDYERLVYILGICHLLTGEYFLTLEYVTRLRELNNELLAADLEEIIRQARNKEEVDMNAIMEVYSKQPKQDEQLKKGAKITAGDPKMEVQGRGVLTVETQFKK